MFKLTYIKNGETLIIDRERCTGCSMCIEVCPHDVLRLGNGKAEVSRREYCMECGACAQNCPEQAISVKSGVGCAAAVYNSLLKGSNDPSCGPDSGCCG